MVTACHRRTATDLPHDLNKQHPNIGPSLCIIFILFFMAEVIPRRSFYILFNLVTPTHKGLICLKFIWNKCTFFLFRHVKKTQYEQVRHAAFFFFILYNWTFFTLCTHTTLTKLYWPNDTDLLKSEHLIISLHTFYTKSDRLMKKGLRWLMLSPDCAIC